MLSQSRHTASPIHTEQNTNTHTHTHRHAGKKDTIHFKVDCNLNHLLFNLSSEQHSVTQVAEDIGLRANNTHHINLKMLFSGMELLRSTFCRLFCGCVGVLMERFTCKNYRTPR